MLSGHEMIVWSIYDRHGLLALVDVIWLIDIGRRSKLNGRQVIIWSIDGRHCWSNLVGQSMLSSRRMVFWSTGD